MILDSAQTYPTPAALLSRLGLRAAHDLNNLIAVLSGHLYLLGAANAGDLSGTAGAATQGAAGTAGAATEGAAGTAESLAAMRTAVAGLEALSKSLSSVGTAHGPGAAVDVDALVREIAGGAGAPPLELDLAGALPPVAGSGDALRAALRALIANAAAAAPGAPVRVATRRDGDAVVVSVEDRGPGVPRDAAARVFDPFFSTRGGGRGTGIGLFVAAAVASAHGTSCRLEDREGGGTSASIRLKIA